MTERADRLGITRVTVTVTGERVGPAALGTPSARVVPFFQSLLGAPGDVELVRLDSRLQQDCFGGTQLAVVEWPGVTLIFVGDSGTPTETFTLFDFRLDRRAGTDVVERLESSAGARLGDTSERWQALHPDATYRPAEPGLIDPSLSLEDGLLALIDPATDRVESVTAVSPVFCE